MSTTEPQATWSITTIDDLIRVIETQSERINQALDYDGDWDECSAVIQDAALGAIQDIRDAAHLLKAAVAPASPEQGGERAP